MARQQTKLDNEGAREPLSNSVQRTEEGGRGGGESKHRPKIYPHTHARTQEREVIKIHQQSGYPGYEYTAHTKVLVPLSRHSF